MLILGVVLTCVCYLPALTLCGVLGNINYVVRNTLYGKVKGVVHDSASGKYVEIFKGIPFASPPKGHLRFEVSGKIDRFRRFALLRACSILYAIKFI